MQSLVIQMTGLLLLTPHNPNGTGRTHLLMPQTSNLPTHVAWIAFRGDSAKHCVQWARGICFVDMDGWSMELGEEAGGAPDAKEVVESPANLTRASGGRQLARRYLGDRPGRRVRSRISLHAGEITDTCSLANDWTYDGSAGSIEQGDTFPLVNLATWTIRDLGESSVVVRRRPLDPASGDKGETLEVLRPDADGSIEMIVMHVPLEEALNVLRPARRQDEGRAPFARPAVAGVSE